MKITVIPMRAVLVALALLVLGVAAYTVTSDSSTQIIIYNPQNFRATETGNGNCWTGSIAAPRAGAFRCMVVNSIFDPCFTKDGTVACPLGDPNRNSGMLIKLTEPLPQPPDAWQNPPDPSNPQPWYVALRGGGSCRVLTGTLADPNFPLGCTIPRFSTSALCTRPVPLSNDPSTYYATCGVWDEKSREVTGQKAFRVTQMWL